MRCPFIILSLLLLLPISHGAGSSIEDAQIVSMGQTIGAASPHVCFPAIRVCLKDYALAIVFLLGVVLLNWLVSVTITLQIGFIGLLIAESIGFYFMMVQARVMGLLYRAHHEEFNWVV